MVRVTDCNDMYERIHERFEGSRIVIKSAAVSDYSPCEKSEQKIKKSEKQLSISLKKPGTY